MSVLASIVEAAARGAVSDLAQNIASGGSDPFAAASHVYDNSTLTSGTTMEDTQGSVNFDASGSFLSAGSSLGHPSLACIRNNSSQAVTPAAFQGINEPAFALAFRRTTDSGTGTIVRRATTAQPSFRFNFSSSEEVTSGGYNKTFSGLMPSADGNWHTIIVQMKAGDLRVQTDGTEWTSPDSESTGAAPTSGMTDIFYEPRVCIGAFALYDTAADGYSWDSLVAAEADDLLQKWL